MKTEIKRYQVFAGKTYYANGGALDYCKSFDGLDEAVSFADSIVGKRLNQDRFDYRCADWVNILDSETGKVAYSSGGEYTAGNDPINPDLIGGEE